MYLSCEQTTQMKSDTQVVVVRSLTAFEVIRLESVIANEERCRRNGHVFSGYDIEQEGRYILGLGQYRAGYDHDYVRYQTGSEIQAMTYTRSHKMKTCLSYGFSVSYWYTKNSRQRVLQNGRVEVTRESAVFNSLPS